MLLREFENAMHKHSSASYAVRVSLPLWRDLKETELIASCQPTSWPNGRNDCPAIFFIGPLLIVVDPSIDIRGQQFFFLPKISAIAKDRGLYSVSPKKIKSSYASVAKTAKSSLSEGFLNRHDSRWMGRS